MMHLTCTNMTKDLIDEALAKCKEYGVKNILALRGDPPKGEEKWTSCEGGFEYASDLVAYIRKQYDDYFCIAVAGYPETHLEAESEESDIQNLKKKVDAGADLIITQLFYDTQKFLDYQAKVKDVGVDVPVIPGIMPIQNYGGFCRMTEFCKTFVPQKIKDDLEPIHEDEDKVKQYGIDLCVEMCQTLMDAGVKFLHFYTLNLEKTVVAVIDKLGIASKQKKLPYAVPNTPTRKEESVRPIFWANKQKSYIARTNDWDEFPNGRWGVSRSPAFGDMGDYPSMNKVQTKPEKLLKMWGTPESEDDIGQLIIKYIQGKVKRLPWSEGKIAEETQTISDFLNTLNTNRMFTTNSQPRVNCASSSDPVVGWGPEGGFVFQKAYCEFLIPKDKVQKIIKFFEKYPSFSYQAMNVSGEHLINVSEDDVNAVTWGVFPAKEIQQPTVVDHRAFELWVNEVFGHIKQDWLNLYKEDEPSYKIINTLYNDYYLMNVVDNDFTQDQLMDALQEFAKQD